MKESDIQKQVIDSLSIIAQSKNIFFFSVPNEGFMASAMAMGMDKVSMGKLNNHYKKMGMVPGVPDICILYSGCYFFMGEKLYKPRTLFIELKKPGGKVSTKQEYVHKAIGNVGHDVEIAYGLEDVMKILFDYGVIG